jgi:transcriptional regulator GlxA family with amidase domain
MRIKRIAFLAYPRMTLLDLVGGYDALRRVSRMGIDRQVDHRIIGTEPELADDSGFVVRCDGVYEDLDAYDLLYVPGGVGARILLDDTRFVDYIGTWGIDRPIASACTGALLLGAAGHLTGLRATTHHTELDALRKYCGKVVTDRVVDEGRVVTAGGVTAAIDLGLHLVEKFWGAKAREQIAKQMAYTPGEPPAPVIPRGVFASD